MASERQAVRHQGLRGNVVDYLFEQSLALDQGERPYLIAGGRTWTFRELADRTGQTANYLKSLGAAPGQRVLFSVADGIDFACLFLAAMKIGAVAVPINTYLKPHDYKYYINDSGAGIVVVDHSLVPMLAAIRGELANVRHMLVAGAAAAEFPLLQDCIAAQDRHCDTFRVAPDDMAFWLYSSGTTGDPKGVVHTGNHIYWATELFGLGTLGMTKDDVILSPPKMYFAFGLGNQIYFPIRAGAQVLVNAGPITPAKMWELWLEHEPTIVLSVPTLYAGMLRMAEEKLGRERVRQACRRLRFCVSGGEILPAALLQRWREFAGIEILDGIGTTEMTHIFTLNRPGKVVPGSCGRLVEGYRAELVDDAGNAVAEGEIGNLRVFGPTAAERYWNKPEKTAQVMQRGGVLTGDKLYQDGDGNLFLVGRSDDMLRVGGVWVSPAEVEGVIAQHEAVLECAVVGHPDADDMIKPKAYIVLRQGDAPDKESLAEKLREHVRERLAHIKCPRWFEFIEELPKTSTGKIQRFRLRSAAPGE
jgi:benzoate-CoA ligase family protein